jgi:SAM-dependent methyltransferase
MPTDSDGNAAKVRAEWMDDVTADGWRRWHDKSTLFWKELTDAMIEIAKLEPSDRVLDLASGTGDPALTVAGRVAKGGHIVLTDLAPKMIEIARANAARAGIQNVSFDTVDAHALPFGDASFDRVTCRLGVMFFWDCPTALREVRRVLKPGGRAAFVAWGPRSGNEYMRAALAPFKARRPIADPPPDAPQPYRFGEPGSLSSQLRSAGFSEVQEETRTLRLAWPGPAEELWRRLYDVSAPMRPYFDSFSEEVRAEAVKEVIVNLSKYSQGGEIVTRAPIVIASAVR